MCQDHISKQGYIHSYWEEIPEHTFLEVMHQVAQWKRIHLHCRRHEFDPCVGKIPLEEEMATHSSILAWELP